MTNPTVQELVQKLPFVYFPNNFCGKNTDYNCPSNTKERYRFVYDLMFPNYGLQMAESYYQAFTVGKSRFIMADTRSLMLKSGNQLFGAKQLNLITNELLNSKNDPNIRTIFMTMTQAFFYDESAYKRDIVKQDHDSISSEFDLEKQRLVETIRLINFSDNLRSNYTAFILIIGEEMNAFDDGTNNNFGGFPVVSCGNLENFNSGICKGGPWSHGYSVDSDNQYCHFQVYPKYIGFRDEIDQCVLMRGLIAKEKGSNETMTFMYDTCNPRGSNLNIKCPMVWTEKLVHTAITIGVALLMFIVFYVLFYKIAENAFDYKVLKEKEKRS